MQYGTMCRVKFKKKKKKTFQRFSSRIHNIGSLGIVFYYNFGRSQTHIRWADSKAIFVMWGKFLEATVYHTIHH